MKIIVNGNLKSKKHTVRRFECPDCGCIFEANENEFNYPASPYGSIYTSKCPCCFYEGAVVLIPTRCLDH